MITISGMTGCQMAQWATRKELRHLFVTILMHCQVSNSRKRKRLRLKDLQLNEKQTKAYTLFEIEIIILKMGKSLKDIDGMPLPVSTLMQNIGDGSVYVDNKNNLINLLPDVYITPLYNQIESIVDALYLSLLQKYKDQAYLKERVILTPKNEMCMS
ncbi:hypothetical protein H5410_022139 [Solanum commersonii]|uniref:ATP-dependent DNA helicase n=1 Tax=Solanum commersonii TaxID=4109 RepID=A0A9J5ZDX8_SOLCO|nr:hypothetical protein H5410_022139 [Solanum commersonii]